jgi:hypothetical protein
MVLNKAGATSTDTIHRITCKGEKPERVISNTYTWLTAASAEIEGRSYGGGVLELEPTEAERLLMPAVLNGAMIYGQRCAIGEWHAAAVAPLLLQKVINDGK